ncbi:hypothetical protein ABC347_16875 [Sphingomonas sp. 1P06PA]
MSAPMSGMSRSVAIRWLRDGTTHRLPRWQPAIKRRAMLPIDTRAALG